MIGLTSTPLLGDGALWWVILCVFLLGAVGSRLLIDMRSSRLSMGALAAAAIAYAIALVDWLGGLSFQEGTSEVMFRRGAEMAGNLLLLGAMTLYARHVILDAEGLLPRRRPKSDDEVADEEATAHDEGSPSSGDQRWTKVDPPHTTPQPAFQRATSSQALSPVASASPTFTHALSPVNRKLTKAERKALKERLLRERLERQRRG
jgi:hypothetical protein